jgi:hypothetical protein
VDVLRGGTAGLAFSPEGLLSAYSSEGERLLVRRPGDHRVDRVPAVSADDVAGIRFSHGGHLLAATDGHTVRLGEPRTGVLVRDLASGTTGVGDLVCARTTMPWPPVSPAG